MSMLTVDACCQLSTLRFVQDDEKARPEIVFAQRAREVREKLGMSQTQLSTALRLKGVKIDPTSITRLEKGTRGIRLDEAVAIARVFDRTVDEMLRPALPPEEQLREAEKQADVARWRAARAVAEMEVAWARLSRLRVNLDTDPAELRSRFFERDEAGSESQ
ncbi:helix-turn-helix transcriptional regulator [Actinomadura sp. NPDC047616]|uniref:helix-turn-helix domain-containing protein n=1 Tax=Actinomadura sp. NPDC047616 TaxID=3155914 RepID=UPI0033FC5505